LTINKEIIMAKNIDRRILSMGTLVSEIEADEDGNVTSIEQTLTFRAENGNTVTIHGNANAGYGGDAMVFTPKDLEDLTWMYNNNNLLVGNR